MIPCAVRSMIIVLFRSPESWIPMPASPMLSLLPDPITDRRLMAATGSEQREQSKGHAIADGSGGSDLHEGWNYGDVRNGSPS
jgi:hypothetical protein